MPLNRFSPDSFEQGWVISDLGQFWRISLPLEVYPLSSPGTALDIRAKCPQFGTPDGG